MRSHCRRLQWVIIGALVALVQLAGPLSAADYPTPVLRALILSQNKLAENDYAAARAPLLDFLQRYPNTTYGIVYLALGNTWHLQQKYPQAYADYQKAYRLSPQDERIVRNLAATAYEMGRFPEAAALFEEAWHLTNEDPLLYYAGAAYYQAADYPKAQRVLRLLWRQRETGPLAWLQLWAASEFHGGQLDRVRKQIQTQLAHTADDGKNLWRLAAQTALASEDTPGAITALEMLARLEPEGRDAVRGLGALYAQMNLPGAAAAVIGPPDTVEERRYYRHWLQQGGQDQKAISWLQQLGQRSLVEDRLLAQLLYRQGRWSEARQAFLKTHKRANGDGYPALMAAYCALEINQLGWAIDDLAKAAKDARYRSYSQSLAEVLRELQEKD